MSYDENIGYQLGRACGIFAHASTLLREDFRKGKYGEDHYEALEEELARIARDTLNLARTLGWMTVRR